VTVSLLNGIFVGSVYGVFAVAIVLAYRVSRTVNFAAANIGMIGAFVFATACVQWGWPSWFALAVGGVVSGVLGALAYWFIVRPLQNRHPLVATLATFGYGALLYSIAGQIWGMRPVESAPVLGDDAATIAGYTFTWDNVLIVLLGGGVVAALSFLLRKTSLGLRIRATAIDPTAASQSGIRVDRVALWVWAGAGATTGLAACLISSQTSMTVGFTAGLMLRALIAALLGGLTSITGAFAGGLLLGVVEATISFKVVAPGFSEVVLGVLVVLLLVVRPTGLKPAEY
jgi:branched-chain amino acid transport system permease protein